MQTFTNDEKVALIQEVSEKAMNWFDTWKTAGCSLAYLMAGIASGKGIDLWLDDPIREFIFKNFAPDHSVWQFITMQDEND